MRPTFSIILFTVLSGAGYGVFFLLGVGLALDPALTYVLPLLLIGSALTSAGLCASVAHLGRPARAWRAFSQWRSSWLSREGVAAVVTYAPVCALGVLCFAPKSWPIAVRLCGLLLGVGSALTVYCTAHIYSSLKPIRAWHNGHVLPGYFVLAVYSGALWLGMFHWPRAGALNVPTSVFPTIVLLATLMTVILKARYWRWLDRSRTQPDAAAASGLAALGQVRSFEQPHTEENYLTHEMGFVLARKHARKLRWIAVVTIVLGAALSLLTWPMNGVAVLAGMLGIFIERWLFFAEARHAVMAYYGR